MSDGATCSTGGVRIFGPEGQNEILYFPEGEEQEELLASIDPDWRAEAEAVINSNEIHDVYLVGESTPDGNAIWARVPPPLFCGLAVLTTALALLYGYAFIMREDNDRKDIVFGGIAVAANLIATIGLLPRCFHEPPAPPSLPTNDGTALSEARDPVFWPRGRSHFEPESFWPLIPAAIAGAILWLSGGGSLGFQTTGFSLAANGTAGPEL